MLLDSLREFLKQKISSPLFATYIASFLILNWKNVLILCFSTLSIEKRIEYISNHFSGEVKVFLYPLGYAMLITLVYPILVAIVSYFSELVYEKKSNFKNKFNKYALTIPESIDIYRKVEADQIAHQTEISNLQSKLTDLEKSYLKEEARVESFEISINSYKASNILLKNILLKKINIPNITHEYTLETQLQWVRELEVIPEVTEKQITILQIVANNPEQMKKDIVDKSVSLEYKNDLVQTKRFYEFLEAKMALFNIVLNDVSDYVKYIYEEIKSKLGATQENDIKNKKIGFDEIIDIYIKENEEEIFLIKKNLEEQMYNCVVYLEKIECIEEKIIYDTLKITPKGKDLVNYYQILVGKARRTTKRKDTK